jgi:outer membrane protein TolC
MAIRTVAWATAIGGLGVFGGCSSPFDGPSEPNRFLARTAPTETDTHVRSAYRDDGEAGVSTLSASSSTDDYVRYALYHSPEVEAAYQRWLAASERLPQARALPDPRLNFGFFIEEIETRTGPQRARIGLSQSFPWPGVLDGREDAAAFGARSAWREFEAARLAIAERVVVALYELAFLDASVRITQDNLDLLSSFEEVVRARYRVGAGSHPALIRIQVELGQLDDRLAQLQATRPALVAELNAAMNRPTDVDVPSMVDLPGLVATVDGPHLADIARASNPNLLALDERVEELRVRSDLARLEGRPDLSVGLDYIVTGEARNPSTSGSGDDPVALNFGVSLPLSREKYDAGVREANALRVSNAHERTAASNRIASEVQRAWFEHTDADRRARLYEQTLIPKAQESLRSTLAGFRSGEASFLDLLDTERTLLEFAVAAERARADRGQALARLNRLVGQRIPTRSTEVESSEVTP